VPGFAEQKSQAEGAESRDRSRRQRCYDRAQKQQHAERETPGDGAEQRVAQTLAPHCARRQSGNGDNPSRALVARLQALSPCQSEPRDSIKSPPQQDYASFVAVL